MERDFGHALKILGSLRSNDLSPLSIETVISGLRVDQNYKNTMLILNKGIAEERARSMSSRGSKDYATSAPIDTYYE